MINGNPYCCYNQKNKQALLSSREVSILFKQIQKIPYMQNMACCTKNNVEIINFWTSSQFENNSVTRTYLLYSALRDPTILTIPRIHNLI